MRILLINHYAGSLRHGMEFRPFYLSRELVRLGHKVTVVAGSYSHVRTWQPPLHGAFSSEEIEGVRYIWVHTPRYPGNGVRRALSMFAFVGQLLLRRHRIVREVLPDAVIASSTYPLDIVPAFLIAKESGARLAFEVHDLWPLSPIELAGMSPAHPFIRMMQWAENFAYRRADRVISMLPNAEPHMRSHGLPSGKFVYVPNGIDPSEWRSGTQVLPPVHRDALDRLKAHRRFLVGYAGAHGVANALDSVIRAAAFLRDAHVTFVLVGQGPEKCRLQELASRLSLANVEFLPPVPKPAMPALLDRLDVLLICLRRCAVFRFGISPNKLMDYMMAAKPVIQAIEAANDLVEQSGCGLSVPPENPERIAEAVLKMMQLTASERLEMGRRGRDYVISHHSYPALAARFLAALASDPQGVPQARATADAP